MAGTLLPLAGSNGRFTPKPVSPRSITVSQKSDTALIRNGKALMAVYVPAGAPQAIHNAAKEFASLLSEIAGKKNSVQVFTKYPSTFKGIVFCLGDKQLAAQLKVKLNSIDRDGYLTKFKTFEGCCRCYSTSFNRCSSRQKLSYICDIHT